MTELTVMRGLPASGKTTQAKRWASLPNRVRVSKDDLRAMFGGYDPYFEPVVVEMEITVVTRLLTKGIDVIVDDTNLRRTEIARWEDVVAAVNAMTAPARREVTLRIEQLDTPLEECIRRNAGRKEGFVPEERIREMATWA